MSDLTRKVATLRAMYGPEGESRHDAVETLLAALDAAEQERDEARHQRDTFERIARDWAETNHQNVARIEVLLARVAAE